MVILKGEIVTMDVTNQNRPKPVRPLPPMKDLSTNEILEVLQKQIPPLLSNRAMTELLIRQNQQIIDLSKRISMLEEKTLKKTGRKKKDFYFNGRLLTDQDIVYYVDNEFISIYKLEKDVEAGKNQLRNRYKKEKQRQILERQVKDQ